jgi:phosphoglycerate kinase
MKSIRDLELRGQRLCLRVDFNVPLAGGRVTDRTRIEETLPTVRLAAEAGARVICASHLGKPKGKVKPDLSLAPVAVAFAEALGRPVRFVEECVGREAQSAAESLQPGEVLLLENLRFHAGEESNDPDFAKGLAALADVYVDDAFGAAHRAHASVVGVPELLPQKGAGLLLEKEVRELSRLLEPERPFAVILGGAKISGKIDALRALARRADILLLGGGMANHFVRAIGLSVGRSLLEEDKVAVAREVLDLCKKEGKMIALPSDFVVAASVDDARGARTVGISKIPDDSMALDVGQKTRAIRAPARAGPDDFSERPAGESSSIPLRPWTKRARDALAESEAVTVVGGGKSVAAVNEAGLADKFTHVSTGGGASLEFLTEEPCLVLRP